MWTSSCQILSRIPQDVNNVVLDRDMVEVVDSVRNLGLIMDQHLTSEKQVLPKIEVGWAKFKTFFQFRSVLVSFVKCNFVNCTMLYLYYSFLTCEFKRNFKSCKTLAYAFHIILVLENILGYKTWVSIYFGVFLINVYILSLFDVRKSSNAWLVFTKWKWTPDSST